MQSLVSLPQLGECRFEKCLVLVSLAGTQGCQSVQAHIDAYGGLPFFWQCIRNCYLDGHKPPVRCFRDPSACQLACEAQILCHIHPAELGDPDSVITQFELIIGKIEARFASLLAFEARAASPAFKERRKRLAQVQNRLIRSILGDFPGPRELLPPDLVEVFLEFEGGGFPSCFILPVPLSQCPVPHEATGSCGLCKVGGLLRRGMESDLVCLDHAWHPFEDAAARIRFLWE